MATDIIPGGSTFRLEDGILVQSNPDTSASSTTGDSPIHESDPVPPTDVESNIVQIVQRTYGYSPKPCQLASLYSLLAGQQDTILYAPTGVGKSLIQQVFPLLCPGWVLCIIPITRLGEDQVEKITSLPDVRAFLLYEKTNTADQRKQLRAALTTDRYTHLFTSPEIAISPLFTQAILSNSKIVDRLKLVAIDELHCVWSWGDTFRPAYRSLHVLRNRINRDIPWFGASATLRPHIMSMCIQQAGFSPNVHVVSENLNRRNIYCDVRPLQFKAATVKDLLFLFPPMPTVNDQAPVPDASNTADNPITNIPKTVVFFRSYEQILNARARLVKVLISRLGLEEQAAQDVVQGYYSQRSERSKEEVHQLFSNPRSNLRILLATDALGMGVNIRSIKVVVQFDLPNDIDTLLQRLGRAGRDETIEAHFVWLIPPAIITQAEEQANELSKTALSTPTPILDASKVQKQRKGKGKGPDKEESTALPEEFVKILTTPSCVRVAIWVPFNHPPHEYSPQDIRCCYYCHPHDRLPIYTSTNEPIPKGSQQVSKWVANPYHFPPPRADTLVSIVIKYRVAQWAIIQTGNIFNRVAGVHVGENDFEIIISKPTRKRIGQVGNYIQSVELLRAVVPDWGHIVDRYGDEVVTIIKRCGDEASLSAGPNMLSAVWADMGIWKKWLQDRALHPQDQKRRTASQPGSPVSASPSPIVRASSPRGRPKKNATPGQGLMAPRPYAPSSLRHSQTADYLVPGTQEPTPPSSQPNGSQDSNDIERIPDTQFSVLLEDVPHHIPNIDELGIDETILTPARSNHTSLDPEQQQQSE